ncbi:hypothetical protein WA026_009572 [Henosepilachna vigintioctopunctata]|uniref:Etoposide-induced protein 2.4 n=1 Tax=Henosepilachna vigintioctopunctata TaxID=420089 RepID=A0AAW1U6K7_9CUCU
MDFKGACFAALRGCFDSIMGISAIFTMKDVNEERTRNLSPYRSTSSRELTPIKKKSKSAKNISKYTKSDVRTSICLSSFMNGGVFLFSILLFNYLLLPSIKLVCNMVFQEESLMSRLALEWIEPVISLVFTSIWVVPLFVISRAVNNLWFQDIADSAYIQRRGRPLSWQSVSLWIADTIFSITVQTLFLIQAMLISYIPYYGIGYLLSLIHMCLLYSLYAFEYKWFNMRWELHRRLAYIERNWPYFIGFGFPLAVITQMLNSWMLSGGIFSLLFPFFIISGTEANPVDNVRVYPLHLFSLAVKIANMIFAKTLGGVVGPEVVQRQKPTAQKVLVQKQNSYRE